MTNNKKPETETGFELVPEEKETEAKPLDPSDSVLAGAAEAYKETMELMREACARHGVDVDDVESAGLADLTCAIEELETLCREIMTSATGGGNHIGFIRGVIANVVLSPVRELIDRMKKIDRDRRAG